MSLQVFSSQRSVHFFQRIPDIIFNKSQLKTPIFTTNDQRSSGKRSDCVWLLRSMLLCYGGGALIVVVHKPSIIINMAARRGSKKLFFPDGALLNAMEVAVVESERRKSDILKEPYTVYLVETR